MAEKSVAIVGAGIAGLSAACYARLNGYRALVLEQGRTAGGLCTAWKRGGYTFDGCLHWLVGTSPCLGMREMWDELGALKGAQVVNPDEFLRIENAEGPTVTFWKDPVRLREHLLSLAPSDGERIRTFTGAVELFAGFLAPAGGRGTPSLAAVLPFLSAMRRWNRITVDEFASGFSSPLLREAFRLVMLPSMSMTTLISTFAWLSRDVAGYPIGGSAPFAESIRRRVEELGGEIRFGARVEKILVRSSAAVGVRLAGGEEIQADAVISAADGHTTIYEMLDGAYEGRRIARLYQERPLFPSLVIVSLGVRHLFPELSPSVTGISIPLEKSWKIGEERLERLTVHVRVEDPTLAPSGCTAISCILPTRFDWWHALSVDPGGYAAMKEKIAAGVIAALNIRFPGLANQVEERDVATPLTLVRYTGNWMGSFEGWLYTPWTARLKIPTTLPKLRNFHMAGQWVQPGGGLPTAARSGRDAVKAVCRADRTVFVGASQTTAG